MGLIINHRNKYQARSMARRPRGHEKIYMDEKRFGYFPQRFIWRGHRYQVQSVESCWTVSRAHLGNKVEKLCFRVRCALYSQGLPADWAITEGTLDLYQDLNTDTWHMKEIVSQS